MSDVDDDLLQFAGEASEDEESIPVKVSEEALGTPDLMGASNLGKKKSKTTNRRYNDSEEEGEA